MIRMTAALVALASGTALQASYDASVAPLQLRLEKDLSSAVTDNVFMSGSYTASTVTWCATRLTYRFTRKASPVFGVPQPPMTFDGTIYWDRTLEPEVNAQGVVLRASLGPNRTETVQFHFDDKDTALRMQAAISELRKACMAEAAIADPPPPLALVPPSQRALETFLSMMESPVKKYGNVVPGAMARLSASPKSRCITELTTRTPAVTINAEASPAEVSTVEIPWLQTRPAPQTMTQALRIPFGFRYPDLPQPPTAEASTKLMSLIDQVRKDCEPPAVPPN